MITCFIALGSNLGDSRNYLDLALQDLAGLENCELISCSSYYQSKAIGPEQPDYINAVCQLNTRLQPLELLDEMQVIENSHDRVRDIRWGPRTLDLDLLLYGTESINNKRLVVPHPGLSERPFVLYPLAELMPAEQALPGGCTLSSLLANCPPEGMVKLSEKKQFRESN